MDVCVAERHGNLPVPEESGHHGKWNALQDSMGGKSVPEVVKPYILNPGTLAHERTQRQGSR